MSKIRLLLAGLGLAALAVPAVALANASGGSCCNDQKPCCAENAACCDKADSTITCPLTGEQIEESECPLCKGAK